MSIINLTPTELRKAADLQDKIAALKKELAKLTDPGSAIPAPFKAIKTAKKKGGMSAAGRAKVAAAQKARWAKIKQAKGKTIAEKVIHAVKSAAKPAASKPATKPAKKGGMSAAGRARIIAAQKARWAKIKAAKK